MSKIKQFQKYKEPIKTIQYNYPELDILNHIKSQQLMIANQEPEDKKINTTILGTDDNKFEEKDENNPEDKYRQNKNIKIYSKYSDLVIGERMSENKKLS